MSKYDGPHRAIRRANLAFAYGKPCARCGEEMRPGEPVDLDHDDANPERYIGWSHRSCNRSAGATKGLELRKQKRDEVRRRAMTEQLEKAPRVTFGVDIAYDLSRTAVARASLVGGVIGVRVDYLAGADTADGVFEIIEANSQRLNGVIIDVTGPADMLVAPLKRKRVRVTELSARQSHLAQNQFLTEIRKGSKGLVRVPGDDNDLRQAVKYARVRKSRVGELVDRLISDVDTSPYLAAAYAVYGLREVKTRPPRIYSFSPEELDERRRKREAAQEGNPP